MRINKIKKPRGVQVVVLGFLFIIILGAILLSLPISSVSGEKTNFLDALFTATSAVCVTGLVTLDTGTHFNIFGQVIIIMLIQVGGLGFMSFTTFVAIILGKKITLRDRLILQDSMNAFNIEGIVKMVKYILIFTFIVEGIGALIFSIEFIPLYGIGKGIFFSIFHSISAFCNAGFDLFGNFSSLTSFTSNFLVLFTASSLIIIGGLGFAVWADLYNYKKRRKISIHSKIVLLTTFLLILFGMLLFFNFECNNPNTLKELTIGDKILNSYFAAITPRTAGFNSISIDGMTIAGKFLTIILMFIGGSPGSTAGGIKTTTIAVLIITVICVVKGREEVEFSMKKISNKLIHRAFTLVFIASFAIITATMVLSYTEVGHSFIDLLFETVSAFGTVGLSTGLTGSLSYGGKVIIMILMFIGRVGTFTVLLSIIKNKKISSVKYPEGKILIG